MRLRIGKGRWRKRKGFAAIRMPDGPTLEAEIHCYEATGIGKLRRIPPPADQVQPAEFAV
jgi:hypothetical protein